MAFNREVWAKEAYMAKAKYQGEFLPTLNKYRPDMGKNKSWHLSVIGALTGQVNAFGSSTAVTYTSAGGSITDKELTTKNTAFKGFELDDDEINTTEVPIIRDFTKQANKAIMNKIETAVLLEMAISSASGNRIELASGNQITLANLQTMEQNILDGGGSLDNNWLVVDPEYLINLQNVKENADTDKFLFLDKNYLDQSVVEKGAIGKILSFNVILSHNLPTLSDDGSAYDAAGEKGLLYYNADAMAVGIQDNPAIDTERDLTNVPVTNKVLVRMYYGYVVVDANLCGCAREYSA
jgi:hypothetical protein